MLSGETQRRAWFRYYIISSSGNRTRNSCFNDLLQNIIYQIEISMYLHNKKYLLIKIISKNVTSNKKVQ